MKVCALQVLKSNYGGCLTAQDFSIAVQSYIVTTPSVLSGLDFVWYLATLNGFSLLAFSICYSLLS